MENVFIDFVAEPALIHGSSSRETAGFQGRSLGKRILVVSDDSALQTEFAGMTDFSVDIVAGARSALAKVCAESDRGAPYAVAFFDGDTLENPSEWLEIDPDFQVVVCLSPENRDREETLVRSDRLVILRKPFGSTEALYLSRALVAKWTLARESRLRVNNLEELIKQRTEDLRLNHERLAILSRASHEAMWDCNLVTKEVWWNEGFATHFGQLPADRDTGMDRWAKRIHLEERERVLESLNQVIAGSGQFWSYEYRFRRADDTYAQVQARGQVMRDANGQAVRMVGAMQDVSERLQADHARQLLEVQLRQAQKLESIGQLAAGVAHEINTPMQFIGDNTRFVRESFEHLKKVFAAHRRLLEASRQGVVAPQIVAEVAAAQAAAELDYLCEEVPKAIDQTIEGVERVTKIVRGMKEFAHTGGMNRAMIDVNRAIESTLLVCRNEWKYVAELVTDFDPRLPLVPVLPGDFNQAVLHVVINAAQAIAEVVGEGGVEKGTITVSTRRGAGSVEIRIRDTGPGIPDSIRDRVFDPFFSTKPVGKGLGQGLAIARAAIVEKHAGTIQFESESGRGTCFIIRLPMVEFTAKGSTPRVVPDALATA